MPGDRPTHAATIRPALVEMPMWITSRLVHLTRVARHHAGQLADAYPDTAVDQLHVVGRLAIAACLLDAAITAAPLLA
jgi:hypothetical protein